MKALYAVHKDGSRMFIGIKPDGFDVDAWTKERVESLKLLEFTHVVEEALLESMSVNELVEMTSELMAALRQKAEEPVVIQYAEDVTIEVRPADDDDRVLVSAKGRGDTVVNYQADGLVLDVYAEEELGTLSSSWFDNADLTALKDGE
jgi:putative heme iron utilization protein